MLAVFFFYPPVWWIVGRLRASAELACDESVLSQGVSPRVYSGALTRVLAGGIGLWPGTRPAEVGLGRPGLLAARLDRIENRWRYRAMKRHRVLAALAVMVLAGSIFVPPSSTAPVDPERRPSTADAEADPLPWLTDLDRLALDSSPIDLEFDQVPLATVFGALGTVTRLRFEGAEKLTRQVSVGYAGLPCDEILVRLATTFRLDYKVLDTHSVRVVPRTPYLAGVDDVGNPKLVMESKVSPIYPEQARKDKVDASVILQAVILQDGTVSGVEVLQASRPDYPGFEEAAIDAVRQWRYEPALKDGVPVDVYFTLFIEYKLN